MSMEKMFDWDKQQTQETKLEIKLNAVKLPKYSLVTDT